MISTTQQTSREIATAILEESYGREARFRPGQLEAIESILAGRNTLVVEKTGWGKSLVYFIATRIKREEGAGLTLIISPLLALMGNQVEAAARVGVKAATINTDNKSQWDDVFARLGEIDALLISPERLSNERFMERIAEIEDISLIVVDEVHSISDWGHDFRPDYQRISKLIAGLPENTTVLGVTATANNRVIRDVKGQLGNNLRIIRGNLIRENLAIQVNPEQTRAQRLAWLEGTLAENGPLSAGQGIIYCLTHRDCEVVANFLSSRGISVLPYYSGRSSNEEMRGTLEKFEKNEVRILAATIKLGMGYDKADIRFIIHFQPPQNLIGYYQQIGRAGRDGKPSIAVLLHGKDDADIVQYFIKSAQVPADYLERIVNLTNHGARYSELLGKINVSKAKIDEALKYLLVHDYIYKTTDSNNRVIYLANSGKPFDANSEADKQRNLAEAREEEYRAFLSYIESKDCYMKHVAEELDAPDTRESCGICANCKEGPLIPIEPSEDAIVNADRYIESQSDYIKPRKKWADGKIIPEHLRTEPGWCLCADYYSKNGQKVKRGKYKDGVFEADLIEMSAAFLSNVAQGSGIDCIIPVPSRRRPELVPSFARALAAKLGVCFVEALEKNSDAPEQKGLMNGMMQEQNIENSVDVIHPEAIGGRTVLLVDDMVDSGWTFAVIAKKLLESGANKVYPFALVRTGGR